MDPNQPDNSFGGPDVPTPEAIPTPEESTIPTPEDVVPISEPTPLEQPQVSLEVPTEPENPMDMAQPSIESTESTVPVEPIAPTETMADSITPTPTVEPVPPIEPTTGQPMGAPNTPKTGPKKGLTIGLIAGIGSLVIIGVILFLVLFVFGGSKINSISELKSAIENKKAVNCTVSKDNESVFLAANDGWTKIRMKMASMGQEVNSLVIEGDATYAWTDDGKIAYKMPYNSSMIGDLNFNDYDGEDEEGVKLDCKPNNQADFNVPSGVNFKESSY